MKVLYVSKALHVAAYRDKLRALSAYVDVRAVLPDRWGRAEMEPGEESIQVAHWPARLHGHNHFHVYKEAARLFDDRPDLVHIDEEPYSMVTLQLAHIAARRRIPSVFFAWQNLNKRLPPPFRALRAHVYRTVDGGIAGTDRAAEVLRATGFRKPIAVIPQFGVDAARFSPDAGQRAETRARIGAGKADFVVGFGGRIVREKGVHLLLEAVRGIPDCHLLLLGNGAEQGALAESAERMGMASRVHFAARIRSLDMPQWIAALDVLALPSLTGRRWAEQFGRILVEAMSCGVPVIGSSSGEIPDVIGSAGIVVPEGDVPALREALIAMQAAPARRATLGRLGRARVVAHFTNERIAEATADFYQSVLREREAVWTAP
jgi:glycosyltransferase involved in cell wall biosynthesis